MTDAEIFSGRLKELRERAGLTQKELAEKAGISQRAVSHYEQNLTDPSWSSALALARALGVTVLAFTKAPSPAAAPAKRGRPRKA